jgi:uncharacterized protein
MMEPLAVPRLLDANVPMYASGGDHPYREACQWVMSEVTARRIAVAIDVEMMQEILYRYGALGRYQDAVTIANGLVALIPQVIPVTRDDIQTAIGLFQRYAPQGVPSRDVVHASVMLNNGLTEIITADRHFDLIAGIHRLDPIVLFRQATEPQL